MPDRYAVIGNPIAHSKSPQIHAAFASETGQAIEYGRILAEVDSFVAVVREFFGTGGRGLNVTVPFKEAACVLADVLSARAELAGAVNTLIPMAGGRLQGDTTDGVGLVRDLVVNQGFQIEGARILLLGAGGAARGVLIPLLEGRPQRLVIANRTLPKAEELALRVCAIGPVDARGFDALGDQRFDLIINATAAGLAGEVPRIPSACLGPNAWVYDMLYADSETAFCRWGRAQGAARALDGLGMLVEQAAESFWIWRGVRPTTAPVIAALRANAD